MSNNLSRRLDKITRRHDAGARRQQAMAEREPFDVEAFTVAFTAFWEEQIDGLEPEVAEARLREAAAAIRAATPQGRSGW